MKEQGLAKERNEVRSRRELRSEYMRPSEENTNTNKEGKKDKVVLQSATASGLVSVFTYQHNNNNKKKTKRSKMLGDENEK